MSQLSLTPERLSSSGQALLDSVGFISSIPSTADDSQEARAKPSVVLTPGNAHSTIASSKPNQSPNKSASGFSGKLLDVDPRYPTSKVVEVLEKGSPDTVVDYTEHLFKVGSLLYDGNLSAEQAKLLEKKFYELTEMLPRFESKADPASSHLYLLVERCFDLLIRISTDQTKMDIATCAIRFLTTVVMSLNYWEVYNLLEWKPAIYKFLKLIHFDMNECYASFIRDYPKYSYKQNTISSEEMRIAAAAKNRREMEDSDDSSPEFDPEAENEDKTPLYYMNKELSEDHDRFVLEQMAQPEKDKPIPRERRKMRVDSKLAAHRIIKRADIKVHTSRSSNYDPDVVHECQLPSPDEPRKLCLRRFSRKYELIRHQETVHSKKKKLFKCFVCVKQDPTIGPRIFTRHDTLAKHIRVNHRISGKEAKAEVAYSKKHAEIVEEGDITVHVGRRKTKVDFELRAHMERRGTAREAPDGTIIFDMDDSQDSIESDEEMYVD